METFAIEGTIRKDLGKKATKALRREFNIPCELYGGDDNVHFVTSKKAVKDLVYTPNFYTAELDLDGQKYKAIVKEIQFHPVTDEILHIDFQQLIPGRVVQTEVPIRTVGIAAGVKNGGKLMITVRKLKVKTTPEHLLDKIEIDVTKLKLGSSFKVRDIPETGMQILNAPSIPVAAVEVPRSLRSAESIKEEEEAEAAAEEAAAAEAAGETAAEE